MQRYKLQVWLIWIFRTNQTPALKDIPEFEVEGFASMTPSAITSATALFDFNAPDGTSQLFRTNLGSEATYPNPGGNDLIDLQNTPIGEVHGLYSSIGEYLEADAPTFDEDNDDSGSAMGLSSLETIDQDKFDWKDSDTITNLDELFDSDYNKNL